MTAASAKNLHVSVIPQPWALSVPLPTPRQAVDGRRIKPSEPSVEPAVRGQLQFVDDVATSGYNARDENRRRP
jgi:hypothetical protein